MDLVILVVCVLVLIVAIVICVMTIKLNNTSKIDYSDVVSDALEKRISSMEQNLADVEVEQQELTRKHNEEMNGMLRELNKREFEVINTAITSSIKEDRENNKAYQEDITKILSTNLEGVNKTLNERLATLTETQDKKFNALQDENSKRIDKLCEQNKKDFEVINTSLSSTIKVNHENNKTILDGQTKILESNFDAISKTIDTRLNNMAGTQDKNFNLLREENNKHIDKLCEQTKKDLDAMNTTLGSTQKVDRENNKAILDGHTKILNTSFDAINKTLETRLNKMTETQDRNFNLLRQENNKQIDKIRETVSEKLDKTLSDQFDKSFKGVITQMTELQKSMGELKGISTQVGSLEKTLNGVKTRGIMGEIQLKQIIADVLTPQQYDTEVPTKPNSSDHVEIAIKIPEREGNGFFYLPIDSKCHLDCYETLLNAYDSGDKDSIRQAKKAFADAIKDDAKKIADKYISVPDTTPYAILFVPFEGMYSEIVNLNLLEDLNQLHITIAGPYTLMAILSTVTNYFQALAIEKKSHEIEVTLGKVKKEFKNYDEVLKKVQKNIDSAADNLEKLQTTRTNAINRALRSVTELDEGLLPEEIESDEQV